MTGRLFLSDNIKMYREKVGITQSALGTMLGVTPQAVSKWENQINYPDVYLLADIAALLHVSIDDLLLKELTFH